MNAVSLTRSLILSLAVATALGVQAAPAEAARGFDVRDLQQLDRVSSPVLAPDGGRVVFANREIDKDLAKASTALFVRDLRSTNSFTHNLRALVKGPDRCTLQVHPDDAARLGLEDGGQALVSSRTGRLVAPVAVTDEVMPGVVSLPHGWGHDAEGTRQSTARAHPGVNANLLSDDQAYDVASGTAVLFGTPVTIEPA